MNIDEKSKEEKRKKKMEKRLRQQKRREEQERFEREKLEKAGKSLRESVLMTWTIFMKLYTDQAKTWHIVN